MTSEPVRYTTVFDLTEVGYRQWTWSLFGLAFVAVFVGLGPPLARCAPLAFAEEHRYWADQ